MNQVETHLSHDLPENAFGQRKRLHALAKLIHSRKPLTVLDVGCGSGSLLTRPLAQNFPGVTFTGLDEDDGSIGWARSQRELDNLRFVLPPELDTAQGFDLVIASEVIEHVEQPGQFLQWLHGRLNPGGAVFLTLPNGFGPCEITAFAYALADRTGLRRWRCLAAGAVTDTLAASPHINFFSFAAIRRVIADAGFAILEYRPRTFLCGGVFDRLVANRLDWNAKVSERLPPAMVSDWMFLIAPAKAPAPKPFRRGVFARLRRRFNEDAVRSA